ncbi:hypothetical protein CPB86DRAFT_227681 [Serendipita vermifera]|nr:hypothetical protein CPB86DRAFT_227681 [Serendipita vermifera]
MSVLVFNDITLELLTRDDASLKATTQFTLEFSINELVLGKVNLLSIGSNPREWKASQSLATTALDTTCTISVWMEADGKERQLIAFMELNWLELCDMIGNEYEIPLMSHANYPSLALKTKIAAIENIEELLASSHLNNSQGDGLSHEKGTIEELCADAMTALQDFEQHGKLERLEQAISQFRTAIEVIPEGDPKLATTLNDLGICLLRRFEQLGRLEDLNESVERHQTAIILTSDDDSDKPGCLNNLGNALIRRFGRLGNVADLHNAIQQQEAAVRTTPDDDAKKPRRLNNLGICLRIRFEQLGNLDDVEGAIVQQQKAVNLALDIDPNKPMYSSNLGKSLEARFLRSGNIADIDGAIAQILLAVSLTSDENPNKSTYLSNLGGSLRVRFERLGNLVDLDNAIKHLQHAVSLTPDNHPGKPMCLTNLGNALYNRFQRLRNDADLNSAILQHQRAANLTPTHHPDKPKYLINLGGSLYERFHHLGNIDDVNAAIIEIQTAINLTPDTHPIKASQLMNLGAFLGVRFKRLGNLVDIDNAIKYATKAVDLIPNSAPSKPRHLFNLGTYFLNRFLEIHESYDAEMAISYFSTAATSPDGAPTVHFNAAKAWIHAASLIGHHSLLGAYGCALDLMPLVAWLGLPIVDRHQHLTSMGGIARDAAAAAIAAEQYDKALEWLEQGRSIVWTQILQLRTPVDQLRDVHPKLADRLLQVSRSLDHGSQRSDFSTEVRPSTEEEGRQYRELTMEWESIIKQVRSLPDFENFLRPRSSSELTNAARDGPIVVFNIAEHACDALALLPGLEDVIHIPLPNITSERITELRDELKDHLYSSGIRMRDTRAAIKFTDESGEENCQQVLAELWSNLVKPVLDALAFSPHPDVLPRIWWCATGPLAFLPIHAAGIYEPGATGSQLSNYVISSYTPTLSTLLDPPKSPISSSFNLLSVIQPSAPGASSIFSTKQELEHIQRRVAGRGHVVLEGEAGTKKRVMKGMQECNWIHLACHGIQVPDEPTKSALLLEDGHLTLEEIIRLDLPHAEFAFLSACQTTTGDEHLSEEAVHIAGGMLLAGYRSVVATMWSIQDELAPMVTDEFYRHIMKEEERPDPRKAAEALHMSVQKLRQQSGVQLTDWIPFVHLGV